MTQDISTIERIITGFSDLAWGTPLLVLLPGGGLLFLVYSRLLPFRYFGHGIAILRGKYNNPDEPGQINHYQALSTGLALIITGVWNSGESDGITLTADAFEGVLPGVGAYLLTLCVFIFSISTMISALMLSPSVIRTS